MEESRLYLIFEFLSMDLKKYMDTLPQDKLMEPELVRSYLYQISAAMLFCHQRRILHRDLKPQNLLINRDGVIKVILSAQLWNAKSIDRFFYRTFSLIGIIDCWFWFGPCFWHSCSRLHTWNRYALVSGTGDFIGFATIFMPCWHLVNRLYICRNGNQKTTLSRWLRDRSIIPDVQVNDLIKVWHVFR